MIKNVYIHLVFYKISFTETWMECSWVPFLLSCPFILSSYIYIFILLLFIISPQLCIFFMQFLLFLCLYSNWSLYRCHSDIAVLLKMKPYVVMPNIWCSLCMLKISIKFIEDVVRLETLLKWITNQQNKQQIWIWKQRTEGKHFC